MIIISVKYKYMLINLECPQLTTHKSMQLKFPAEFE